MPASLLIVGIDGGTFDLAAPWAGSGVLPNLAAMMQSGSWGDLISTYPPITAPAWSSLMTGCNPGKHGVFDFLVRDPRSDEVVDARAVHQPTLWEILSRAGRRVGVVSVPLTFPPSPVNGVMVAGPLSPPDPDRSAWPVGLIQKLERETGRRWWQYDRGAYAASCQARFIREKTRSNVTVAAFARRLLLEQSFDVFMVVFNLVDAVSHFFWHYMDSSHPSHQVGDGSLAGAVEQAYRAVDGFVGELREAADAEIGTMVVSDHGFGPVRRMVNLNNFLVARGHMALRRGRGSGLKRLARRLGMTPGGVMRCLEQVGLDGLVSRVPRGLRNRVIGTMGSYADVDWERTVCYARGHMGQVHFTPRASADPARFRVLRDTVLGDLRERLCDPDTGRPLVTEALLNEDIYHGPYAHQGPDVFLVMDDWQTIAYPLLSSGPGLIVAHVQRNRYANHRMNGMFCADGTLFRAVGRLGECSIMDVAPTVLYLLGVPPPDGMDGRVLQEIVARPVPVRDRPALPVPATTDAALTEREQRDRRERLRGLGYLE
jgi:predicted AlkP superfamily phosphohydrolase/phosphomutase